MTITAEQFFNTVRDTSEANGLDIPPKPETIETDIQDNPDNNTPQPQAADKTPAINTNKEPNPATPPAPVFNLDEELVKTTNGAIKTKEDLAGILANATKATELETRLKALEQENTSLKSKADADPFANDYTKKLNELYRSGANQSQIDAFVNINKVSDIDALKPIDACALALQVKHGLTDEEARVYLSDKYKIDLDDPNAVLDKNAEIALKIDSTADREFLKMHKAEVSQVPVNQQAQDAERQQALQQQAYTEKIAKLDPIGKTVVTDVLTNSFKGISLNGKEDASAIRTDLPISEESKAALAGITADMIASNWDGLSPDEKGQEAVKTFADNVMVLQNWKNWLIDVASKTEMRVRAEYSNASPINRGEAAPALGKTKSQERVDSITKALQTAGEI